MNVETGCGNGNGVFIVIVSGKVGYFLRVTGSGISEFVFGTVVISSVSFTVKRNDVSSALIRSFESVERFGSFVFGCAEFFRFVSRSKTVIPLLSLIRSRFAYF